MSLSCSLCCQDDTKGGLHTQGVCHDLAISHDSQQRAIREMQFNFRGGGGGGGHSGTEGGGAPALGISRKKGSFLRPPHVRDFVKEGYFFVPRYEVRGGGGGGG